MSELIRRLERLVHEIHTALSDDDRHFLLDLKLGNQEWKAFPLPEVERLPSIQWKLLNLARMIPEKRQQAADKLKQVLGCPEMTRTNRASLYTALIRAVVPEWKKVVSPMVATMGFLTVLDIGVPESQCWYFNIIFSCLRLILWLQY